MSADIDDGIERLSALVATAPPESRQAMQDAIKALLMVQRAVSHSYAVGLPASLQGLSEDQLAAIRDLVGRAVAHGLQQLTLMIGMEMAESVVAAAKGRSH